MIRAEGGLVNPYRSSLLEGHFATLSGDPEPRRDRTRSLPHIRQVNAHVMNQCRGRRELLSRTRAKGRGRKEWTKDKGQWTNCSQNLRFASLAMWRILRRAAGQTHGYGAFIDQIVTATVVLSVRIMPNEALRSLTVSAAHGTIAFVDRLPRRMAFFKIGMQLFDSGTSQAANYRAPDRAQSTRALIAKLKNCRRRVGRKRVLDGLPVRREASERAPR
jgi:hypothetical protein